MQAGCSEPRRPNYAQFAKPVHIVIDYTMTRRALHPQYTMGVLRSRIVDKGPGVQAGWVMTLWGAPVDVGRLRNP